MLPNDALAMSKLAAWLKPAKAVLLPEKLVGTLTGPKQHQQKTLQICWSDRHNKIWHSAER